MKEKIKQEFIKFGFTEEKSEEIAEGLLKGRKLGFATPKKDSPKLNSLILLLRKFNFEVNISKVKINPHFVIVTIKLKEDENGKIL